MVVVEHAVFQAEGLARKKAERREGLCALRSLQEAGVTDAQQGRRAARDKDGQDRGRITQDLFAYCKGFGV